MKYLSRYYANANRLLNVVKDHLPGASEVRCWPHHFDIATLYTIDKDKPAEETRSIGIGLAPGGGEYEEFYYYLTPWPYPDIEEKTLPELAAGTWHTKNWIGAVLTASEIYTTKDQSKLIVDFINSAILSCAALLEHQL